MSFVIRAIYVNNSERVIDCPDDFDGAVKLVLKLADQRLTPLSEVPAMSAVELSEDGQYIFAMAVVRK